MDSRFILKKHRTPGRRWQLVDAPSVYFGRIPTTNDARHTQQADMSWGFEVYGRIQEQLAKEGFPNCRPTEMGLRELAQTVADVIGCSPRICHAGVTYEMGNTNFVIMRNPQLTGWTWQTYGAIDGSKQALMKQQRILRYMREHYGHMHPNAAQPFPTRQAAHQALIRAHRSVEAHPLMRLKERILTNTMSSHY